MGEEFNNPNSVDDTEMLKAEEKGTIEEKGITSGKDIKTVVVEKIKILPIKTKLISLGIIVLIVIILFAIVKHKITGHEISAETIWGEEGKVTTITETDIREVLEISELQTAEYIYNSIVTVYLEDSDKVKYYVAYNGTVHAGIDFSKIQISVNNNTKEVHIIIPEVYIQDTIVETESLDFIFTKDKYDTASTHKEAYSICDKDLREKAESDKELLENAEKNVRNIVEGLLKPWIEELNEDYAVIIE